MRRVLLSLIILLWPAAPLLAQVTVDLRALDALPRALATHRAAPPAGARSIAHPSAAMPPRASAAPQPPATPTQQAALPQRPTPSVQVPTPPNPPSPPPHPQPPPAPPQPPQPPPATFALAPPPVAALPPIQTPAAPAGAPPAPPPIAAGAATAATATNAGLRLTFATGQSDLSPGSADSIKRFVQAAPAGDATTFNVLAYATGAPDDPSVARRLSLARAIAVREALMADGVPSTRIYLRALGSQHGDGPADRVDLDLMGANAGGTATQR